MFEGENYLWIISKWPGRHFYDRSRAHEMPSHSVSQIYSPWAHWTYECQDWSPNLTGSDWSSTLACPWTVCSSLQRGSCWLLSPVWCQSRWCRYRWDRRSFQCFPERWVTNLMVPRPWHAFATVLLAVSVVAKVAAMLRLYRWMKIMSKGMLHLDLTLQLHSLRIVRFS